MAEEKGWIIAPHPDDDLIGCYKQIKAERIKGVAYYSLESEEREAEAKKFCRSFNLRYKAFDRDMDAFIRWAAAEALTPLYLPSPNDRHAAHRLLFYVTLDMRKDFRLSPTYVYSVYMDDFFATPLSEDDALQKRNVLNAFYASQSSLWQHDHRYFLFEGMVRLV